MHSLLPLSLLLVAASAASAASTAAASGGLAEAVVGLVRGCAPHGAADPVAWECLRGRALDVVGHSLAATLDKWRLRDVEFGDNVVLVASPEEAARAPRTLFKGGSATEIVEMVANFLQSRTLQVRFPKELIPSNLEEGDSFVHLILIQLVNSKF